MAHSSAYYRTRIIKTNNTKGGSLFYPHRFTAKFFLLLKKNGRKMHLYIDKDKPVTCEAFFINRTRSIFFHPLFFFFFFLPSYSLVFLSFSMHSCQCKFSPAFSPLVFFRDCRLFDFLRLTSTHTRIITTDGT